MNSLAKTARRYAIAFGTGLLASVPAHAVTFKTLANGLPGSLQISAVVGTTAFGTTLYGGLGPNGGAGTLLSVTSAGKVATLHKFNAGTDGQQPNDLLAADPQGNLYGTTQGGGQYGGGTIYEFTAAHTMKVLHAFNAGAGDGASPLQGLVRNEAGALYGAAAGGAIGTNGSVFEVTPKGAYGTRYEFMSGADGHCPFSSVAVDTKGNVYGTVVGNGFGGDPNGAVWKLSPANKLTPIHIFGDGQHGLPDGEYPDEAPVVDATGNVYGTSITQNDTEYAGVVWKVDTAGKFTIVHQFTGKADGYGPNGPLMIDTDGNLYGTTQSGGVFNGGAAQGTLFRITPAGVFSVIHTFTGGSDGAGPTGTLAHDSTGAIYGATAAGTVYKLGL
jgi:uncharacterized repeat protein (TIGR03803 family)